MMIPRAPALHLGTATLAILIAWIGSPCACWAISPLKLAGAVEGRVSDIGGKPQMGAVVQIYNRQEKLLERQMTDGEGFFVFAGLLPDVYSVRVTLATFLPALRSGIQVQAGQSSLLDVNLSGLFSAIHLLPGSGKADGILNDDWKWILRSSSATRPVFRYLPQVPAQDANAAASSQRSAVFTDTHGLVSLSAGDGSGGGAAGEVGTAFAFGASVLGVNQVALAGDVGYGSAAEAPSAAIRTTFSRAIGEASPEVSFTVRQLYVPRWEGIYAPGSAPMASIPPMRSMAVTFADKAQISDSISIEYGAEFDTISFVDHLHYFSPYARLSYTMGDRGKIDVTYTSGNAHPELGAANSPDPNVELQRDVASLGVLAPVTLRSGRARVQRGEDYEVGYSRRFGSREVRISGYREEVQDAALLLAGADGAAFAGDLIPDVYTDSLLFDAGNYHTMGYTASVTQDIADNYKVTVMYGSVGVLAPRSQQTTVDSADDLRALIRPGERQALTTRISGTAPRAGTHFIASYQFMDDRAATAGHLYATDSIQPASGLNFTVRQPVPAVLGLPFRMEATVDLTNMLAQGYLPVSLPDGRQLLLVHTPRSVRAGLNFRF